MSPVVIAVLAVFGLTAALATLLVVAHRRLFVWEDPRIDVVEEMLPHANCGACGLPGCRPFAEALVAGTSQPGQCTVSSEPDRERVADFLGVDVGGDEKRVARLACGGGSNVARSRADYRGPPTCAAAALIAGGGKGCSYGCLGYGDCVVACTFDAIRLDAHDLPRVSEDTCTACGDCVRACPKDLLSIHPVSHRLWVACASKEAGEAALVDCEVGCDACGRCAQDGQGLIEMRDNLPVVDYSGAQTTPRPAERCPTGAIVWLEPGGTLRKGAAAKKILRRGPRNAAPT